MYFFTWHHKRRASLALNSSTEIPLIWKSRIIAHIIPRIIFKSESARSREGTIRKRRKEKRKKTELLMIDQEESNHRSHELLIEYILPTRTYLLYISINRDATLKKHSYNLSKYFLYQIRTGRFQEISFNLSFLHHLKGQSNVIQFVGSKLGILVIFGHFYPV